jgi:hypothetical protein
VLWFARVFPSAPLLFLDPLFCPGWPLLFWPLPACPRLVEFVTGCLPGDPLLPDVLPAVLLFPEPLLLFDPF